MQKPILVAILPMTAGILLAQGPKDFVGTWKSDPGGPVMTRKLELEGNVIVMSEIQPGRNGGPERTIIRKYPTDGSEVKMDSGIFAGATATGKMEGNVLTVDTTMANGQKFHDVWTLSEDKKHYTNEMVITGGRGGATQGEGAQKGDSGQKGESGQSGNAQGGEGKGGEGRAGRGRGRGSIKFSFTKEE
jgi:hypothetical protein